MESLRIVQYHGRPISVFIDKRDKRGGEKNWEWIKKGVPLRLEVGPRDIESQAVMVCRRDKPHKEKSVVHYNHIGQECAKLLDEIQHNLFEQAQKFRNENICTDIQSFDQFKDYFTPKNTDKPEIHGGFVLAKWCGDPETEKMLDELKVAIRCLPLKQSGTQGVCILTGKPATLDAIFAKSY